MKQAAEVVVIGAGVNGLTAACLLAKQGRRVLVLEAREHIGGLAARSTIARGYTAPGVLQDTAGFRVEVERALELKHHGLRRRAQPAAVWGPASDGPGVWIKGDEVVGDVVAGDAGRFKALRALVERLKPALVPLINRPAPDPQGPLPPLIGAAWGVRRLGAADLIALTRIAPMASGDWLRDALDTERLRSLLALQGLTGSYMGPWSAGSAANLLLTLISEDREVVGGPAAVVDALERAAGALGVEIRPRTPVEAIRVRAGRAEGVVLPGGDEIDAQTVVSSCDPRSTLLGLVGAERLPDRLVEGMRNWRCRGITSAVHLALSAPLTTADGEIAEAMVVGETLDELERSFDAAKHRSPFNEPPAMQVRQPSVQSPELTPAEGHHVATVLVHGTPFDLQGGWSDALRHALGDAVVSALARHCPDVEASVVARQVLTPEDLHHRFRLTGGHVFHGEHAADQLLFLRPNLACSDHVTPIAGLFLCGAGTHPGGGVTGAPAMLAAQAIERATA